jgi:hypothetical protein
MNWHEVYEAILKFWDNIQYFIAGFLGASVVTRYHKDRLKTWHDYTVFILSGAFTAHYLTQVVIYWLDLEPVHAGGIGFLLGAFGGMVIQELTSWIKNGEYKNQSFFAYFGEMIKSWLNRGKK